MAAQEAEGPGPGTRGDRIVVTIGSRRAAAHLASLERLDDRLDIRYDAELLPAPEAGAPARRSLAQDERWQALLAKSEVLLGLPDDSPDAIAAAVATATRLRWIQLMTPRAGELATAAGLGADVLGRVAVTGTSGAYATPLAEFALASILSFTKSLPQLHAAGTARRWEPRVAPELSGRTVLVVGLGGVGHEVARLSKAFGMRVLAINRLGRTDSPHVDEVRTSRFLGDLLPVAHAVVLALPLTRETKNLLDARRMTRLRADAFVVNVGSAGTIDEQALAAALTEHRIGGAALDVFSAEPLPPQSPLWDLPGVLISPHSAACTPREDARIGALLQENLRRYLAGRELSGRVRPALGY
jgi:phosphoglycerate dehydrogenase-like enzyme